MDIELHGGSVEVACFTFHRPAPGTVASDGPDSDCVVDKIEQFKTELSTRSTPDTERLLALKFLMRFVRDLHPPLYASDNLDRGGNHETVAAFGSTAALHSYCNIEAAQWLGPADARGRAMESYALAENYAYSPLPTPTVRMARRCTS